MGNRPWHRLSERLLAKGWVVESVEVREGLRSPNNACVVIPEDIDSTARRATLVESLRRQCKNLVWRINKNTDPDIDRMKLVLRDFEELLDELAVLDSE